MFIYGHFLYKVGIILMFDLDMPLFMLNMCNSIIRYFDCSHVSIEFVLYSHIYVMVKFIVRRTNAGRWTGLWWMYRLKCGRTQDFHRLSILTGDRQRVGLEWCLSLATSRASVAQLVRARDCQSLGRRFNSV